MWSSFANIAKQAASQLEQGLGEVVKAGEGLIERVEDIVENDDDAVGTGGEDSTADAAPADSDAEEAPLESLNGSGSGIGSPQHNDDGGDDVDEDPEAGGGILGGLDTSLESVGGMLGNFGSRLSRATGRSPASAASPDSASGQQARAEGGAEQSPSRSSDANGVKQQLDDTLAENGALKEVMAGGSLCVSYRIVLLCCLKCYWASVTGVR